MRLGKRIFPYPTLNRDVSYSNIEGSVFKINDEYELINKDNNFLIKNVCYDLDDDNLRRLIQDRYIKVYLVVESSSSVFKKTFPLKESPQTFKINTDNLKDRVEISAYGVVNKDINNFSLNNFNDYYKGFKFNLKKNNIILIDDGFSFNVEYDETEDDLISSIFTIIKDMNNTELISVSSSQRKIIITLPEEPFNIYEKSKNVKMLEEIFFANLLIPALLQELIKLQNKSLQNDNHEDIGDLISENHWFLSVANQYENIYEEKLTTDIFRTVDILELSQKLINEPVTKSISRINDLLHDGGADDEEYSY